MISVDDFIKNVARQAGQIQKETYHKVKSWRTKSGRGDIVTEVDLACEKLLIDRIKAQYPKDAILSEEAGAIGMQSDVPVWIIDPLDGTRNYMAGIPFFCVSIGLVRSGVAEVGAVYDAIHDELFFARRGAGAFLNDEPIKITDENVLDDILISIAWVKRKVSRQRFVKYIDRLGDQTSYFRRLGSAALVSCYVACGRINAYLQAGLNPWDMAAGTLIIEEAGGVVTDFDGKPIDLREPNIEIVTAGHDLHSMLMRDVVE